MMDMIRKTLLFDSPLISKPIKIKLMKLEILNWGLKKGYNTLADCMISQIRWHQASAKVDPLGFLNFAVHGMVKQA